MGFDHVGQDIIIGLIYRQSCRKYLAAARKQSALDHLWA